MRKLNRRYRKKDRPTDVLSFSELEGQPIPSVHSRIGEVLLCWSVAQRQANESKTTARNEVEMLVVHGVLHLFGYDHEKDKRQAKSMFSLQNKILKSIRG